MKKFIVPLKTVKKNLGQTALTAVVRGAGGVGGAFIQNKIGSKLPSTLQKHKGAVAFLLGTAIDVFVEQPQLKALGQGIAVSGVMQEAIEFAGTDLKPAISLQGIEAISEINADNVDWDALAKEVENDTSVKGLLNDEPEEEINGVEAIEETNDSPASLLS